MLNLSPWYYRDLISERSIIVKNDIYEIELFDGKKYFESNAFLNPELRPEWLGKSKLYKDCDGSGTDIYKNIAVYKGISEALERFAFYQTADLYEKEFCFDLNPTTTGMAAFPHLFVKFARENAKKEAVERWAIHQFNLKLLPVVQHRDFGSINVFELVTPFSNLKTCILHHNNLDQHVYSFATDSSILKAIEKAQVELSRNMAVLKKLAGIEKEELEAVDRTLAFYASQEGFEKFNSLIKSSPDVIVNVNPRILCDKELIGPWTKYTKVWRYLLEDSYFDCSQDRTFFMF